MNVKEFLKKEGINEVDEGCLHYDDNTEWINERILTKLIEEYHQAKLKLLGIPDVSNCDPYIHDTAIQFGGKCGKCGRNEKI